MESIEDRYFLTVNAGSSSLKINLFKVDKDLGLVLKGSIQDISNDESHFLVTTEKERVLNNTREHCDSLATAAQLFAQWLFLEEIPVTAIGYRIVQGGTAHRQPELIDSVFLEYLKSIRSLAPTHIPDEMNVISTFMKVFPTVKHIACFDTFFHSSIPPHAKYYPLPRFLWKEGVQKYGFHGLSFEYIMQYLQRSVPDETNGKIVIAHLGNGSSLAAVNNGVSVDTTMGMTPIGGLMMGTRCGDVDPGVLLYLLIQKKMTAPDLEHLLSHESGLKGVSEVSADLETLLSLELENSQVAEALDLFCYNIRKMIGAMTAVLNGIDTLIFTGGIGEHASVIRNRICDGLQYLGIRINSGNGNSGELISSKNSAVKVRVIKTDEAYMIAKHMLLFS
ncbi:acetate/propionate family kinase [Niabella beijingensis]|uniref:acetate/propionate family kinase n=1 Tax=Niabella beijingensis TaxID=2872700 RepID=UPI001CBBFB95|nr:acetate/propionate family kinase [Niabella beijingensis]MBZ4191655.1 acetate/propionate family kinase [Niabella beijingensis]